MAYPDAVGTTTGGALLPLQTPYTQQIARWTPYAQQWLNTDPIWQGQVQGLIGQLRNAYIGNVTTPATQAYLAYGGDVNDPALRSAISQYGAPNLPWAPNTALDDNLKSLAGTLANPDLAAQAQANPFSAVASIARQLSQGNQNLGNVLAGRGMTYSGATEAGLNANVQSAAAARATALQDFLKQINSGYSSYLGAADQAVQNRLGYLNDANSRFVDLVKAGMISGPTKAAAAPKAPVTPRVNPYGRGGILHQPGIYPRNYPSPDRPQGFTHFMTPTPINASMRPSDAAGRSGLNLRVPTPAGLASVSNRNVYGPA